MAKPWESKLFWVLLSLSVIYFILQFYVIGTGTICYEPVGENAPKMRLLEAVKISVKE